MEQIAREMPELSLIDEDYGQLEMGADEDHYPVTFPCVLIGNVDSEWHDLGYGAQNSESLITVRLAIDCYDDTHYSSGTYDKANIEGELGGVGHAPEELGVIIDDCRPLLRKA